MKEAELGWKRRQGLHDKGSSPEGIQGELGSKRGIKRTHDEASSGSSE